MRPDTSGANGNITSQYRDGRPAGYQRRGDNSESGHGNTNVHASNAHSRSNCFELGKGASASHSSRGPQSNRTSVEKPLHSSCLKEIKCDLFEMPIDYALAHCVGSDFIMSSGVAVKFR